MDSEDFRQITRVINGGLNGLVERTQFWEAAKRRLASKADHRGVSGAAAVCKPDAMS
jgi:hypothetical protein